MDTLTHALSGALLARATAPQNPKSDQLSLPARMGAGFLAAAFPDADFVLRGIDSLTYFNLHRGVTHSLILLPVLALFVAIVLSWLTRSRYCWQAFYAIALLGILIHIAGDVITSWGTMFLAPVSYERFALPYTFIIDLIFSGIIIAGLVSAWIWKRRSIAVGALTMLAGYVGFQAWLHQQAIQIGEHYAAKHNLPEAVVHAFPQPWSPFNWMILDVTKDSYHIAYVNLIRKNAISASPDAFALWKLRAEYQPRASLTWRTLLRYGIEDWQKTLTHDAWEQPEFKGFREFAQLPVMLRAEALGDRACAWFTDARFLLPGVPARFVYGMCLDASTARWEFKSPH